MNSPSVLSYEGFDIPTDLVDKTGGGVEDWAGVAENHMRVYATYAPIEPHHHVLEIGCGVGRDAIPLTKRLGPDGSYTGVDIMHDCIDWCRTNITPKHPNFTFHATDIRSADYNPTGSLTTAQYELPLANASIDRVILQSVFTHLLEDEITHYLSQFRRVLRDGGLVCATCFLIDSEALELARTSGSRYTFDHVYGDDIRVHDSANPRRVVGIGFEALHRMLQCAGMELTAPPARGYWSGRPSTGHFGHFQDVLVIRKEVLSPSQ
jgi:SAM-dependent methyltransferase